MTIPTGCPFPHDDAGDHRRAVPPGTSAEDDAPVRLDGRLWRVGRMQLARHVLRERRGTVQAGFTAERIPDWLFTPRPILIADGPGHDEQRRSVARFLAPTVVAERYGDLMERCARERLGPIARGEVVELDDVALHFAVEVTAEVVGLTHRRPGDTPERARRRIERMSRRLESFFRQPPLDLSREDLGRSNRQWMQAAVNGLVPLLRFGSRDVLPAIRERRRQPQPDVLSHLIQSGLPTRTIMVEAITYGTAGMVTTREFICMAAWYLLTDDDLREHYLAADEAGRHAVLHEVLRLEPVVGHLYRRATEPVSLGDVAAQPGQLIDIDVRRANVDADVVGPHPLQFCPGRRMAAGTNPAGLAFGDGVHKCPGQPLAVREADALLRQLLARGPELVSMPHIPWDDLLAGYQLRGLSVRFTRHSPCPAR